jgi:hypothetical protein
VGTYLLVERDAVVVGAEVDRGVQHAGTEAAAVEERERVCEGLGGELGVDRDCIGDARG